MDCIQDKRNLLWGARWVHSSAQKHYGNIWHILYAVKTNILLMPIINTTGLQREYLYMVCLVCSVRCSESLWYNGRLLLWTFHISPSHTLICIRHTLHRVKDKLFEWPKQHTQARGFGVLTSPHIEQTTHIIPRPLSGIVCKIITKMLLWAIVVYGLYSYCSTIKNITHIDTHYLASYNTQV
jgi:hypothetical protein